MFTSRGFTRLKQLEYLINTGQLDADFFWKDRDLGPRPDKDLTEKATVPA
jgi:hypothetical protein